MEIAIGSVTGHAELQSHQIQASRASGGSAGNTIIASSYFGGKCFFSGKVADDENGHFYMQDMHA